jgi:hypothetical protein
LPAHFDQSRILDFKLYKARLLIKLGDIISIDDINELIKHPELIPETNT